MCSAMGVRRSHYANFAAWLADRGYTVRTFDYRGIGDSVSATVPGSTMRMQDWGELDIDAVLRDMADCGDGAPLFLVGHSCGGQLFGLAENSTRLDGLILAGSQQGNWRLWPFPDKLGLILAWSFLLPLASLGRDYFPARLLRLSPIDVPVGVIRQWASWGRQKEYLFSSRFGLDLSRYASFSFPVLVCRVSDDRFAPARATEGLLKKFPGTRIQRWYVNTEKTGHVGHFGYFRSRMQKILWVGILEWLEQQAKTGNGLSP